MLFAGNRDLREEVEANLSTLLELHFTENIRPSLDFQQIEAAQSKLAQIYTSIRTRQLSGVMELNSWVNGGLIPSPTGLGRVVRFLSQASDSKKGVLGIDVGASAVTIASAIEGELSLAVYPQYGMGESIGNILKYGNISELIPWLLQDFSEDQLREYLFTKSTYPASLPVTEEEINIEQALARVVMRKAVRSLLDIMPEKAGVHSDLLLPWMEPLIASGSVLSRAPTLVIVP
jgi:hypothetical protein